MTEMIANGRLIAVVRGDSAEKVVKAVEVLATAGISLIEITYTNEDPLGIIRECSTRLDATIGAGTVLNVKQAKDAVDAGAKFIVSPCLIPEVVSYAVDAKILAMPGVFTPTEVHQALGLGAEVLKLFPGSTGGVEHLKALRGPFPELKVVPTGGVDASNIPMWFAAGAIAVGLGGNLVSKKDINSENYEEIASRASDFLKLCGKAN